MKKIFTILGFSLIAAVAVKAQAYIPFPDSNAVWLIMHEHDAYPGNTYSYVGMKNSDTVIGGVTYHKVYETVNDTTFDESEYIGGLRQDTGSRKVYFYNKTGSAEYLLYNFSLQPGDTMTFHVTGFKAPVAAIDTVMINGQPRRHFTFATGGGNTTAQLHSGWIEGIGNYSVGAFLGDPAHLSTCSCNSYVSCFKQDNSWLYHNTTYTNFSDCESVHLEVPSVSRIVSGVMVYPNPVTGISHLQVNSAGKSAVLCIYNIIGIKVRTFNVDESADITIDKNDFPSGIYSYRISGGSAAGANGKFVVQ